MADRSVKVRLQADVAGFVAGMNRAKSATADFTKNVASHKQASQQLGRTLLVAGAAVAAGIGLAVKTFADFDKAMSGVRAVSGATASQMAQLSDAALKAGADTVFSASDAAKAESELAKAGVSVSDILGGALIGSMNLAAAGQIDLADAATISAQAMNIFSLKGKDVGHIADVLTAGANKSAAGVADLGQALRQGGLVASQTGLTFEETVATLSAFADSALIGSDAGTSLKTMLQRLTPQSKQASDEMAKLGFSAYDAKGNFVGMPELAGRLKDSFGDLTPQARNAALAVVFGSDAVRGANVLMKQGEQGIRSYIKAVEDDGAAARMAGIQMDNLSGDVEQLKGSLETALIKTGSGANSVLRDMAQMATNAVNAYSNLPKPLQEIGLGLAGIGASGALAAGAFLTIVPKIAETKKAIQELGIASKLTKTNLMSIATGPIGFALAGLTIAVGLFAKSQIDAKARADDLRASLDQQTGAITDNTRMLVAQRLQSQGAFEQYGRLAGGVDQLTKAALGNQGALDKLHSAQQANDEIMNSLIAKHGNLSDAEYQQLVRTTDLHGSYVGMFKILGETTDVLNPQIDAQKELAKATGGTKDQVAALTQKQVAAKPQLDAFGNVLVDEAGKATDAKTAIQNLANSIRGLGNTALDASGAEISFQQAIDDATKSVKDNGRNLNITTAAGRANRTALNQIATSSHGVTAALVENNASQKRVTASMHEGRAAFIAAAIAMGSSRAEARRLADQAGFTAADVDKVTASLHRIPKNTTAHVRVDAAGAIAIVGQVRSAIASLHDKHITITTTQQNNFNRMSAGRTQYQANGGVVDYFANGAENHVAQIAPAGSMRVWAEPETGGEAYIPLSPAKRERSEAILDATAARFGKVVVDAERRYASGALVDYPRFSAHRAQAAPVAGVSVAVAPGAGGPLRIEGVLDLGNGLSGFIDGRLTQAAVAGGKKRR